MIVAVFPGSWCLAAFLIVVASPLESMSFLLSVRLGLTAFPHLFLSFLLLRLSH